MATKTAAKTDPRGTKRTCQNSECGSRFYDLNRDPIACPICGESYEIASTGGVVPVVEEAPRKRKPVVEPDAQATEEADADADDALVSLEDADAEIAGDDDETFLEEEEEEGAGVTSIIGGPGESEEEV